MKRNSRDWLSRSAAAVLLTGAVGLIGWQGMQYVSEEKIAQTVQRVQPITTAISTETAVTALPITDTFSDAAAETALSSRTMVTSSAATSATKPTQTQSRVSQDEPDESEAEQVNFPLELNAATVEELEQLPGIGTVLAERIVDYRMQIGGFLNREQLLEVEGIGDVTLGQIYDLVYLTDEQFPSEAEEIPPETMEQSESEAAAETEAVPVAEEITTETAALPTEPLMVDLNSADFDQLMKIPGMTQELAEEILVFRTEYQYFSSVYELLYLEHMSESTFAEVAQFICVEEPDLS